MIHIVAMIQTLPVMVYMATAFGALLLIVGLWLLWTGLKRRTRGTAPHCRGCHYNLTGRVSDRCPECGADLTEARAVVEGQPYRRTGRAMAGGLFVICAGILISVSAIPQVKWYRFCPTSLVMRDLDSSHYSIAEKAWTELDRRILANKLSKGQQTRLYDVCLARQQTELVDPVTLKLLTHLTKSALAGLLDDKREEQFYRQLIQLELQARPRAVAKDGAVVFVKMSTRNGHAALRCCVQADSFRCDGEERPQKFRIEHQFRFCDGEEKPQQFRIDHPFTLDVSSQRIDLSLDQPGKHTIEGDFVIRVYPPTMQEYRYLAMGTEQWKPALYQATVKLKARTEILAEEPADYIRRFDNPEWAEIFAQNVRGLGRLSFSWETQGYYENGFKTRGVWCARPVMLEGRGYSRDLDGQLTSIEFSNPTNLVADVYIRIDGREYRIEHAEVAVPKKSKSWFCWVKGILQGYTGPPVEQVDLVLRPNEDRVRKSVDMYEMYNRPVIIRNVKTTFEGYPAASQPASVSAPS